MCHLIESFLTYFAPVTPAHKPPSSSSPLPDYTQSTLSRATDNSTLAITHCPVPTEFHFHNPIEDSWHKAEHDAYHQRQDARYDRATQEYNRGDREVAPKQPEGYHDRQMERMASDFIPEAPSFEVSSSIAMVSDPTFAQDVA